MLQNQPFQNIKTKLSKRSHHCYLDKREWATVQDEFLEAECGGNLPVGWVLWRVYSVNTPGFYKPVLIKNLDSDETKCYQVNDEWLFAFCQHYITLL